MIRLIILSAVLWGVLLSFGSAQVTAESARVDAYQSTIEQTWRGRTEIRLHLSQGVPFRVFTLDNPARLIVDFRDLEWSGPIPDALIRAGTGIEGARFGAFQPGWSRLVADLTRPMLPEEIGMSLEDGSGAALLTLSLAAASTENFAAASGVPQDTLWPMPQPEASVSPLTDDRFVVMIDPGHGGIDPGAQREGLSEKVLMLDMAVALRTALKKMADVDVALTRESDVFVSLQNRLAQAHQVRADLFISLHADALTEDEAQGATVYLLSEQASDAASAHLAARHNRADIIAGADLTGSDDQVAGILLDLARQETAPRSDALARALVRQMMQAGGPMNSSPLRRAGFSVLKSADIPSTLVEVGFLSNPRDIENLRNPQWRAQIVEAMAKGILDWRAADAARRAGVRQ